VRKISMKRKHTNRRAKSKLAFRKTKKLVRKSQTRRRQIGGGGCQSIMPFPQRNSEPEEIAEIEEPVTKEEIDTLLNDTEIEEPVVLDRFKQWFEQGRLHANSEVITREEETTSLLFYVVSASKSKRIENIHHNLFRWLIKEGAEVNYRIPSTFQSGGTPYESLNYTIVGYAILLFSDVVQSICHDPVHGCMIYNSKGYVDENPLYDLYNCIYTLVLLLSNDANVLVKIGQHTPLDVLNGLEITRILTIIGEVNGLVVNMETIFSPRFPPPRILGTEGGTWSPPPPSRPTVTKEYIIPRLLVLFEPIESLIALAMYNQEPKKGKRKLKELADTVKLAAMAAVTAINDLSPASASQCIPARVVYDT